MYHGVYIQVKLHVYACEAKKRIGEYVWTGGLEFGVHGWRKYLYECTPFRYVNL